MSVRKSLGFGDKPKKGASGSPRFRKSNQAPDGSFPLVYPPQVHTEADISDLAGKTPEELKAIAAETALVTMITQMRAPTRHAGSVLSAARHALDFTVQKPADMVKVTGADGGAIQTRHEIVFVDPK